MHIKEIYRSSPRIYFCKSILDQLILFIYLSLLFFSQFVGMIATRLVKLGLEVDRVIRPRYLLHELLKLLLLVFQLRILIEEAREALEGARLSTHLIIT